MIVLNTKEAMLELLEEIEETRTSRRGLDPHDNPVLDVLADMPNRQGDHLRYEQLAPRATFDVTGYPIRVGALEDIISSKEWPNRPKYHEALPELHATRDARTPGARPPARPSDPAPGDGQPLNGGGAGTSPAFPLAPAPTSGDLLTSPP